jgi:hypothetical protein
MPNKALVIWFSSSWKSHVEFQRAILYFVFSLPIIFLPSWLCPFRMCTFFSSFSCILLPFSSLYNKNEKIIRAT